MKSTPSVKHVLIVGFVVWFFLKAPLQTFAQSLSWWPIQAVDTRTTSLDKATSMLKSPESFSNQIDAQVKTIADFGATHIIVETPYEAQFLPILKLWVRSARANNLKVWFRGNFVGWDKSLSAGQIDPDTHKKMVREFLDTHTDLFEDGDIFSSCDKCELGPLEDPRLTQNAKAYRAFMIDEFTIAKESFFHMGKNVTPNLFPMPQNLANIVLDEDTTRNVGGYATVDFDATDSAQLISNIAEVESKSKGRVVVGMRSATSSAELFDKKSIVGIAVPNVENANIGSAFRPAGASGSVFGRDSAPLSGVLVRTSHKEAYTDQSGKFVVPLLSGDTTLSISLSGYHPQELTIGPGYSNDLDIRLEKEQYSLFYRLKLLFQRYFH